MVTPTRIAGWIDSFSWFSLTSISILFSRMKAMSSWLRFPVRRLPPSTVQLGVLLNLVFVTHSLVSYAFRLGSFSSWMSSLSVDFCPFYWSFYWFLGLLLLGRLVGFDEVHGLVGSPADNTRYDAVPSQVKHICPLH
ncbi:hypothetical protein KIN20_021063 [Parelaphostrongylus tenuis]|uniref:Uncharacterized protein n=1 Tax=Parelaphostrongylus tenuis TaxID=148309 RepID=A0AAD5MS51_PARTN|nr:hypothetical protein KIN20_021063 [Parelaphostrongylus tenuis]